VDAAQKFLTLLQQTGLTDDQLMNYFQNGELNRVTVQKKSRVWKFNITLDKVLPIDVFQFMQQRVHESFAAIANVHLEMEARNNEVNEQLIIDYWPIIIDELADISPPMRQCLVGQTPKIHGEKLLLNCSSDLECQTLKNKYIETISALYQQFGFPKYMLDVSIVENHNAEEERQQFLSQKKQEEDVLSKQAYHQLQQRESMKSLVRLVLSVLKH